MVPEGRYCDANNINLSITNRLNDGASFAMSSTKHDGGSRTVLVAVEGLEGHMFPSKAFRTASPARHHVLSRDATRTVPMCSKDNLNAGEWSGEAAKFDCACMSKLLWMKMTVELRM